YPYVFLSLLSFSCNQISLSHTHYFEKDQKSTLSFTPQILIKKQKATNNGCFLCFLLQILCCFAPLKPPFSPFSSFLKANKHLSSTERFKKLPYLLLWPDTSQEMQTPKARASSSGTTPQKNNSPRSSEASQKNNTTPPSKLAITTSEVAQKVSPRVVRQLKTGPRYSDHTASSANLATKPPKERSPKVADHKSPNSPASEKKRLTRVSELENDLKLLKDQLRSTEELKEQAEKDAEQSRQQLSALQKQFSNKQETHTSVQTDPEPEPEPKPEPEPEAHQENQENELNKLKQNLSETLALVEDMKAQLTDSKASENRAHSLAQETLTQLEAAKKTVDALKSDGLRAAEAQTTLARELESSRARITFLEAELLKLEDSAEKAKSEWAQREAELESELRKSRYEVEELRANLMDKENELQGIWEENERLESSVSGQGLTELRKSLDRSRGEAEELRARLAEKEAEFRVELEVKEKERNSVVEEIEAVRAAEVAREAAEVARAEMEAEVRRMRVQSEQWRKAAEVAAAMISAGNDNINNNNNYNDNNGNGQVMERTGSMDSHYGSPRIGKVGSPYVDDVDDDLMKKKNGNKMRRFGSLWKKQQK
ncbi:ROP interactive partner 5, partial [Striga asiatica]